MSKKERTSPPPRSDDYRRYFDYANDSEREDEFFDTGYSTDFRYFASSRYEDDEFQQLEQRGTMSWGQETDIDAEMLRRPGDFAGETAQRGEEGGSDVSPGVFTVQSIKEVEEERKAQEFRNDPYSYVEKHIRGIFPTAFRMKILCLLLLLFLSALQYIISDLGENLFYGHDSVLILFFHETDMMSPVAYALHPSFYVVVGMALGFSFFLISILPPKPKKYVKRIIYLVVFLVYLMRAFGFLGPLGSLEGEGILMTLIFFLLLLLITSYLIVAELGILFLIAGPAMCGTYGILKISPWAIKISFFLLVFYVFDAIGSLSTEFLSFVFFSILLFVFLQIGLQLCELHQFHKENCVSVSFFQKKMVLHPSEDRNADVLKDSFPQHITLTFMNLTLIFLLALFVYFSSELIALFLSPGLRHSIEMSSMAGKLISTATVLCFLLFLKLFFGSPSDKVDRKVFKRRRLERILSDKKSAFYVESTVSEKGNE